MQKLEKPWQFLRIFDKPVIVMINQVKGKEVFDFGEGRCN